MTFRVKLFSLSRWVKNPQRLSGRWQALILLYIVSYSQAILLSNSQIMSNHILNQLNSAQVSAVSLPPTHALVLAGAGSGKTRVLVHRMAYLFEQGIPPGRILAVTFTNKAASEMKSRIEHMLPVDTRGMWVGTFHGLAHRLLRLHFAAAALPESFQVLDSDDQYRLVRRLLKQMNLDEKQWPVKTIQHRINGYKDQGLRAGSVQRDDDFRQATVIRVYLEYENYCQKNGLVDFAELLLRCYELLRNHVDILAHYHDRFEHILVDEFQDTNQIQYQWLKLICGDSNYLMAVGDDDQSIYAWRGAQVGNIRRFTQEFPHVKTIRLEQNYRSTKMILKAANAVIANNPERMGKKLWTAGEQGETIALYAGFNELDEARFVVERIKQFVTQGFRREQIAILYRANALSRVMEEALLQAAVPYRVYGGLRFFERAEIKDVLAYLRLIRLRHDEAAFERIVNTPTRGIGDKSMQVLRDIARSQGVALWQAIAIAEEQQQLSARALNALKAFQIHIQNLADKIDQQPLYEQVDVVVRHSGLIDHYKKDALEKAQARMENLAELVTAARQFRYEQSSEENLTELDAFLAHAALESGETQADAYDDCVQLMTLHAAKGLEFPVVFMMGCEDDIFPSKMAQESVDGLCEERRLCYVGMTRAMQHLYITYAEYRRLYGESRAHHRSRFIREIPQECLQEVRMRMSISWPNAYLQRSTPVRRVTSAQPAQVSGKHFFVGQSVHHPKFGAGTVLNYEGHGDQTKLQIQFGRGNVKWLLADYVT